MEVLIKGLFFILLSGLFVSPLLIVYWLNRRSVKYKFITYMILCIVVSATLATTLAWWAYKSDKILLSHYGYDFEGMNDSERFANVRDKNREEVKSLENSIMGIGWPLKAIVAYAVYFPYLLVGYLVVYLIGKRRMADREFI